MNSRQSRSATGGVGRSSSGSPQYRPRRGPAQQGQQDNDQREQRGLKKFFKDISWAQIIASGLSAITVFLLSAKIGLAGSIIGAALASIISTVTSQLYRNVLDESSKHVKNKFSDNDSDAAEPGYDDRGSDDGPFGQGRSARSAGMARRVGRSASGSSTAIPGAQTSDGRTSGAVRPATDIFSNVVPGSGMSDSGRNGQSGVRRAADGRASAMSAASAGSRSARSQAVRGSALRGSHAGKRSRKAGMPTGRKVVLVAIVSALLALGVVSGVIMLATHGQGTDTIVRDAVSTAKTVKKQVGGELSDGSAPATGSPSQKQNDGSTTGSQESGSSTGSSDSGSSDSNRKKNASEAGTGSTANKTDTTGSSAATGSTGSASQQPANKTDTTGSPSSAPATGSPSQKQNDGSTTGSQESGSSTGSSDSGSSDSNRKKNASEAGTGSTTGNVQTSGSPGSTQ
ncbi:MAG: hypothetical protein IJV49_00065 [Aeriscardovia sp.]|nr:hypothetical protein [Aeriscardovia sp.]